MSEKWRDWAWWLWRGRWGWKIPTPGTKSFRLLRYLDKDAVTEEDGSEWSDARELKERF